MDSVEGVRRDLLCCLVNERKYFKNLIGSDGQMAGHLDDSFSGIQISELNHSHSTGNNDQQRQDVWSLQLLLSTRQLFLRKLRAYAINERELTAVDLPKIQTLQSDIQRLNNQLSQRQDALREAYAILHSRRGSVSAPVQAMGEVQEATAQQSPWGQTQHSHAAFVAAPWSPAPQQASEPSVVRRVTFLGVANDSEAPLPEQHQELGEAHNSGLDDTDASGTTDTSARLARYRPVSSAPVSGPTEMADVLASFHKASWELDHKLGQANGQARPTVPGGSPTSKFDTLMRKLCSSPAPVISSQVGHSASSSSSGGDAPPVQGLSSWVQQAHTPAPGVTPVVTDAAVQVSMTEPAVSSAPPVVDRVRTLLASIGCDDVLDLSLGGVVPDTASILRQAQGRREAERRASEEGRGHVRSSAMAQPVASAQPPVFKPVASAAFDLGDDSVHSILRVAGGQAECALAEQNETPQGSADSLGGPSALPDLESLPASERESEAGPSFPTAALVQVPVNTLQADSQEQVEEHSLHLNEDSSLLQQSLHSPVAPADGDVDEHADMVGYVSVVSVDHHHYHEEQEGEGEGEGRRQGDGASEYATAIVPDPPLSASMSSPTQAKHHTSAAVMRNFAHVSVSGTVAIDEEVSVHAVRPQSDLQGWEVRKSVPVPGDHKEQQVKAPLEAAQAQIEPEGSVLQQSQDRSLSWALSEESHTERAHSPVQQHVMKEPDGTAAVYTPSKAAAGSAVQPAGTPYQAVTPQSSQGTGSPGCVLSALSPIQPLQPHTAGRTGPRGAGLQSLGPDSEVLDQDTSSDVVETLLFMDEDVSGLDMHAAAAAPTPGPVPAVVADALCTPAVAAPSSAGARTGDPGEVGSATTLYTDSKPPKYNIAANVTPALSSQVPTVAGANAGGIWHVSPNTSFTSMASADQSLALSVASRPDPGWAGTADEAADAAGAHTPTPQTDLQTHKETAKAILFALLRSPSVGLGDSSSVNAPPSSGPDAHALASDRSVEGIRFKADAAASGGQVHKRLQFDDPAASVSVTASSVASSLPAGSLGADTSQSFPEQQGTISEQTSLEEAPAAPVAPKERVPLVGRKQQKKNKLARRLFDDEGAIGEGSSVADAPQPAPTASYSITTVLPPVRPPSPMAARQRMARSSSPARLVFQDMEQQAGGQHPYASHSVKQGQAGAAHVATGLECELELAGTSSWEYLPQVVTEASIESVAGSSGGAVLDTSLSRAAAQTSPRSYPIEEPSESVRLPLLPGLQKREGPVLLSPLAQALSSASRLLPSRIPMPTGSAVGHTKSGVSVSPRKQTRTMLPTLGVHGYSGPIKALPLSSDSAATSIFSPPTVDDAAVHGHGQIQTPGTDPKGTPGSPSRMHTELVDRANVQAALPASPPQAPSSALPYGEIAQQYASPAKTNANAPSADMARSGTGSSPSPGKPPKAILSPERQAVHAAAAREESLLLQKVARKAEKHRKLVAKKAAQGVMSATVKRHLSSAPAASSTPEDPSAPVPRAAGSLTGSPRPMPARRTIMLPTAIASATSDDGYSPDAYSPSTTDAVEANKLAAVHGDSEAVRALNFA